MDISTNEETKVRSQLHKSFKAVKNCLSTWKEALAACQQPLYQVENLCEQHQCCSDANIEQSGIIKPFPDIKMRLLHKIDVELEEQLSRINVEMKKLDNCCERIGKHCHYSMKSYQENSPYIPLDKVLEQTPTCPAISDMLEWLQQIERLVFQQYHCKKYLLEMFSPKNKDGTENLKNTWSLGDQELINTVEEYLSYTSFFLEEKIT
ncbi:hypothetical protein CHS0354_031048 [Potamilus streckersoni]|nr:hypothetical protein CHS0354_031048 [Potamilus streckersoni]